MGCESVRQSLRLGECRGDELYSKMVMILHVCLHALAHAHLWQFWAGQEKGMGRVLGSQAKCWEKVRIVSPPYPEFCMCDSTNRRLKILKK